jgi:ubiquinone/menaquinone biosynthesis C-methylase UbiE
MIDAKKLSNWYDFQAPLYRLWRDDYDGPLVLIVRELLGQMRAPAKPMKLLDAGCGTGMFALGLAKRDSELAVEGLDASAGMLSVAQRQAEKLKLGNVRFTHGDVTALPHGDGAFDTVVAAGLLPNVNDMGAALREFWRVLAPGGNIIFVEFDASSMGWALRAFFNLMIFGYRIVSRVVPRFRFAEDWSIERSTIDRARFESELGAAGFDERASRQSHHHLIFHYAKGLGIFSLGWFEWFEWLLV